MTSDLKVKIENTVYRIVLPTTGTRHEVCADDGTHLGHFDATDTCTNKTFLKRIKEVINRAAYTPNA